MELKVKGKGIAPLVKQLRVKVRDNVISGLDAYNVEGIRDEEFDVIALGEHTYEDRSKTTVAFLATPKGIREVALTYCIATEIDGEAKEK